MAKIQTVLLAHIFRCKQTSPTFIELSFLIFLLHCNELLQRIFWHLYWNIARHAVFQRGHLPKDARAVKSAIAASVKTALGPPEPALRSSDRSALKTYLLTQACGKASICWEPVVLAAPSRSKAASCWPRTPRARCASNLYKS